MQLLPKRVAARSLRAIILIRTLRKILRILVLFHTCANHEISDYDMNSCV